MNELANLSNLPVMCIPLYQYQSEELTIQTDIFRLGFMLEPIDLLVRSHFRGHIWTQRAQNPQGAVFGPITAGCLPLLPSISTASEVLQIIRSCPI